MKLIRSFFTPTKRAVAANTTSQLVGKAISAVSTLIVTVIVARHLGAGGYGDFVKITTYLAFFYLIADFGINAIYLQHADEPQSWYALITIRTLGSVLLIMVSLAILAFLPSGVNQGYTMAVRVGILLYSPTILLQAWITTANAVFQKKLRYDLATWAIFFGSVVMVGLMWGLFYVGRMGNVMSAIIALLAGTFVTSLLSFWFAFAHEPNTPWAVTGPGIRRLLLPSLPLGITLLFNLVYFRADSVIITLTRPTSEVGVYGLAYKVFEVILVFPTFFMNAVYPLLLTKTRDQFQKIATTSFLFLLTASFFVAAILWLGAPLIIFIKSDFLASVGALRTLSLGLPFFFVTSVTMWMLIAMKKQVVLALIYGFSMFMNIAGNIVFIPTYGYMAAAWMTVAGEALILLLSGYFVLKYLSQVKAGGGE